MDTYRRLFGKSVLILSPHADDACFSLAGILLHGLPQPIRLLTLFGVSRWTRAGPGKTFETTQRRYGEDQAFAAKVKASLGWAWLPDTSIRTEKASDLVRGAGDADTYCPLAVEAIEREADSANADTFVLPLGIGDHLDHLVSRAAAEVVAVKRRSTLIYFEDLPYASRVTAGRVRSRCFHVSQRPRPVTIITNTNLSAKLELARMYDSQFDRATARAITAHHSSFAGRSSSTRVKERLWVCAPAK